MKVVLHMGPMQFRSLLERLSEARTVLGDLACRRGISVELADAHDTVMDAHTHFHNATRLESENEAEMYQVRALDDSDLRDTVPENLKGRVVIDDVDVELLDRQRLILATIPMDTLDDRQKSAVHGIQHLLDHWSDNYGGPDDG
jgi:hypothetical protein